MQRLLKTLRSSAALLLLINFLTFSTAPQAAALKAQQDVNGASTSLTTSPSDQNIVQVEDKPPYELYAAIIIFFLVLITARVLAHVMKKRKH